MTDRKRMQQLQKEINRLRNDARTATARGDHASARIYMARAMELQRELNELSKKRDRD